jgi:hypothetical protein
MTGAYNGGLQLSVGLDLGTVGASSTGPILSSGASSFVKGAWTQLSASLAQGSSWMMLFIETLTSSGSNYCVDIGVGASGSEVAVVSNLLFAGQSAGFVRYMFPLTIPAATRVAARTAGNGSPGGGLSIGVTLFCDSYQSAGCGSAIDTYGFNSATILGTSVDPGSTANTKGAYSQIVSSTVADIGGIFVVFDAQNTASGSSGNTYSLIDIAVGPSGSEVVIIPNIVLSVFTAGTATQFGGFLPYMPIQIQAGSRISVRSQSSTNASPDRIIGCTIFGVRL